MWNLLQRYSRLLPPQPPQPRSRLLLRAQPALLCCPSLAHRLRQQQHMLMDSYRPAPVQQGPLHLRLGQMQGPGPHRHPNSEAHPHPCCPPRSLKDRGGVRRCSSSRRRRPARRRPRRSALIDAGHKGRDALLPGVFTCGKGTGSLAADRLGDGAQKLYTATLVNMPPLPSPPAPLE